MTALHVHLVPLGGLAGDMFVAAVLDALPGMRKSVLEAVCGVLPKGAGVRLSDCTAGAIGAKRFRVDPRSDRAPTAYPAMAARLDSAGLDATEGALAAGLLRDLAQAEAAVHRVTLDEVHFHELADWDTLADLCAAAVILARPGIGWSFDPLPLGSGQVATRHGRLPVPAPATARLLSGLPVHDDGIEGERVTPTGAVIARAVHARAVPRPAGTLGQTGYGAGTREIAGLANIVVAQVIHPAVPFQADGDIVGILEFDIDDMTAEEIAVAAGHLRREAGVIDLTMLHAAGKKGRPVTQFRLLIRPESEGAVAAACFAQTSTLGLRRRREERLRLPRAVREVQSADGPVRVKVASRLDGSTTRKVEADDLARHSTLRQRRAAAREVER